MQTQVTTAAGQDFKSYILNFEQTLKRVFHEEGDINQLSLSRGLPEEVWKQIMDNVPLSVAIPSEYGGRGSHVRECLGVLSAASYESLPLSLTFGINIALFLEPLAKYGKEEVKADIFRRFLEEQRMGGLMITEPDFGSDALNMRTSFRQNEDGGFKVRGVKHWQGLTGMADFWLIAARRENEKGDLARDIDFFIADVNKPGQEIVVEEIFDNPGLYMIPYGRNILDLKLPENYRLQPESTGIKMMLDILHRSRLQFPGMGMGFVKRMLDEAMQHCENRMVGKSNLMALDQVQYTLSRMQSAYTLTSGMCSRSCEVSSIENNLATEGLEANSMKAVVTDLMQESANSLVQLSGAQGYRISHIGGRGIMDSRPFQIFEGSNEMLYSQIAEMVLKAMRMKKVGNLFEYLREHPLTSRAADFFNKELDFSVEAISLQRKMVDLGRVLGRVVCAGYAINLADKGFNKQLVENSITHLQQEIRSLVSSISYENLAYALPHYQEDSAWWKYVK